MNLLTFLFLVVRLSWCWQLSEGVLDPSFVHAFWSLACVGSHYFVVLVQDVGRRVAGGTVGLAQRRLVDRRALDVVLFYELAHLLRVVTPVDTDHNYSEVFVLALECAYDRGLLVAVRAPGGEEDQHGRPGFARFATAAPGDFFSTPDLLGSEARSLRADRKEAPIVGCKGPGISTPDGVQDGENGYRQNRKRCRACQEEDHGSIARGSASGGLL